MREYRIKKGHNPDIEKLINKFFRAKGDIFSGVKFEVNGIGKIDIRQDKNYLFVEIKPPKTICGDYSVIKKWNEFLFEATGMTTKERKKEFSKCK